MTEALARSSGLRGYRDVLGELGCALDRTRDVHGSAIVVRGEPGSGKSTLLRRTADVAVAEGWQVFQVSGVPDNAAPPFSALRSLAYPVLNASREMPAALRTAMLDAVAGGVGAADALLAYSGLRQLLFAVARRRPTMVIIDDCQWLDAGSAKAVAFLAHRLSGSHLALMASLPLETPGPLDGKDTVQLVLSGLDDRASDLLLMERHPDLAPHVRAAVTATAQGNPLVLTDIPSVLTSGQRRGDVALPDPLPVGVAVERALGGPFRALPVDTRVMLHVLALTHGGATRKDMVSAAEALGIDAEALVAAEKAGLVAGDQVLSFSRPVHRCLAESTAPAPAPRPAGAGLGATRLRHEGDEQEQAVSEEPVVQRLDAVAQAAIGRRDWGSAFRALQRSAEASTRPDQRSRRYAAAGEAALRAGRPGEALALVRDIPAADRSTVIGHSLELVRACAEFDTLCRVEHSSGQLTRALFPGTVAGSEIRDEAALRLAETGSLKLSPEPARAALEWLAKHDGVGGEPLRIAVTAHLAPVTRAAEIRERLFAAVEGFQTSLSLSDPRELVWMADAALRIDEAVLGDRLVTTALRRLDPEDHSRIQHCEALQADLMLTGGRWTELCDFAQSRREKAKRNGAGRRHMDITSRLMLVYACQGRYEQAERLVDEVRLWGTEHGSVHHLQLADHAAHLMALARGDDASVRRSCPPLLSAAGDPMAGAVARRAYVDVIRAALTHGDAGAARDLHERVSACRLGDASAEMSLAVRHGAALLAAHENAADTDQQFRQVLQSAHSSTRPFARARLALDYGKWLRRQRETVAARTQLRASQDVFVRLGAVPWRDMALAELRAIGVSALDTDTVQAPGAAFLSAQEGRIARLAAQGLSNRQIADRLCISPRTVGSHLYKVYPRLGVSSRRELMRALGKFGGPV